LATVVQRWHELRVLPPDLEVVQHGVQEGTAYTRFLYQQQGLLQIFEDFCLADSSECAKCNFPKMVSRIASQHQAG
jgi:hypothetical protein